MKPHAPAADLADFTATRRVVPISVLAVVIGGVAAFVAYGLLHLIDLSTNLFYYQRVSFQPATPQGHHLGPWSVLVPIVGALVIGLMARFGSERIRGHGIPEALEAILFHKSRIDPKIALLKPISSAISIGSGGPFGSEGPIIMTGGAVGSIVAQLFSLTSAERKTLLVAGAAAGMSATFDAPIASVLLAVELLLFEYKPRSFIPVALASATAAATRHFILGDGPLFSMVPHAGFPGVPALAGCAMSGLLAGLFSMGLTAAVYKAEDAFKRVPLHWMWWPAIGGLAIGVGGLLCPDALGVGYASIERLLHEDMTRSAIAILVMVKASIWSISLGSGTSGGVLAPLLMMGAALGAVEARFFPVEAAGFWPLVSMAAILGGTMRSPLTGMVFTVELTHDMNMLLPLAISVTVAHAFTVLALDRSILTEKVARRDFHVSREYAIDALEILLVRDAMDTSAPGMGAPVPEGTRPILSSDSVRAAVHRMAGEGVGELLVASPEAPEIVTGKIALRDALKARTQQLDQERKKERLLEWERVIPRRLRGSFLVHRAASEPPPRP